MQDDILNTITSSIEYFTKNIDTYKQVGLYFLKFRDIFLDKVNSPLNIDDLAQAYSKPCDEIILKAIANEQLSFIGGEFYFELKDEKTFVTKMEAYFKNANDEWLKKENETEILIECLTSNSQIELKKQRKIVYELTRPKTDN